MRRVYGRAVWRKQTAFAWSPPTAALAACEHPHHRAAVVCLLCRREAKPRRRASAGLAVAARECTCCTARREPAPGRFSAWGGGRLTLRVG